jgi:hypothetical protein
VIFLPLPPQCWDYKHVPSGKVCFLLSLTINSPSFATHEDRATTLVILTQESASVSWDALGLHTAASCQRPLCHCL